MMRGVSFRRALATALAAIPLGACALNPVTKTPEVVFTTTADEVATGAAAAAEVEETIGLVHDDVLQAYVAEVGARIAAHSPRQDVEYHFAVVDMEEPNAFALPGGWVFVSRGLLAVLESEDELAGVMAHEVVHVAARHAVQRQTAALPIGVLSALGGLAGGLAGVAVGAPGLGQVVGGIPELAGGLLLASYGRDQERESDQVGQDIAARAGWDPAALPDALDRMERLVAVEVAARGESMRAPSWFDSHPTTPERSADARRHAESLSRAEAASVAPGRDGFVRRLDGMQAGPDPAEGVFRDELYLHPDLGFGIQFPFGWRTHNGRDVVAASSKEGDAVLALRLQAEGDDPAAAAIAFARKHDLTLSDLEHFEVNGLPAARALAGVRAQRGAFVADFTWVVHAGRVYRLTGAAPVRIYEARARELVDTARSFRPLSENERSGFEARRLRLAEARAGETLKALGERSGNRWSVARTAASNALEAKAPLAEGFLVKIAVDEPYVPADTDAP